MLTLAVSTSFPANFQLSRRLCRDGHADLNLADRASDIRIGPVLSIHYADLSQVALCNPFHLVHGAGSGSRRRTFHACGIL